jgi:hypothetical protein
MYSCLEGRGKKLKGKRSWVIINPLLLWYVNFFTALIKFFKGGRIYFGS